MVARDGKLGVWEINWRAVAFVFAVKIALLLWYAAMLAVDYWRNLLRNMLLRRSAVGCSPLARASIV